MQRRHRLTSTIEIMRVRRSGKSFAHPLLVLIIRAGNKPTSRFAVTASTALGNAVKRNRAKRLLRAALQENLAAIKPGYEGVLIARKALLEASSQDAAEALRTLLGKAGIGPGS